MTKEQIIAKLQTIFDKVFVQEVVVTEQLSAADVPEWDSLSHISLVLAVEKAFGIRFKVGEIEATQNIGDLTELIQKRIT